MESSVLETMCQSSKLETMCWTQPGSTGQWPTIHEGYMKYGVLEDGGEYGGASTAPTLVPDASSASSSTSNKREATVTQQTSITGRGGTQGAEAGSEDTAVKLNIETIEEMRELLKTILQQFLEIVEPLEAELLDLLYAKDVLTFSDYESVRETKPGYSRKDRARHLWFLLNKVSVEDFTCKVFPSLHAEFPHLAIPAKFIGPKQGSIAGAMATEAAVHCLRHDLKRHIRPGRIADLLYRCESIDLETYRSVMADIHKSSRSDDSLWGKLFEAFGGRSELITEKLKEGVQTDLLDHRRIHTPPNLGELLHRGVPCTCRLRPQDMPRGPSWTLVSEEARETDQSSVSANTDNVPPFQTGGSHYLGSQDPDFNSVVEQMDPAFFSWTKDEELSVETMWRLVSQGVKTMEGLRRLSPEDLEKCLVQCTNLPLTQYDRLKDALKSLPNGSKLRDAPGLNEVLPADAKVRLLLVGKTGSGKSSSGNTILALKKDKQFTASLAMGSETKHCQIKRSEDGKVEVMDCPGLFDTSSTIEQVCTTIVKAVCGMCPGPTAILYTLRIGDHYTDEEFGTYQRLKAIFGEGVTQHMIILFTRGDDLKREGQTIEGYIKSAPPRFKQVLEECGNRYVVFDNTLKGLSREQIEELHGKLQMVAGGESSHYKLKHFSDHKEKIEREVRQLLDKIQKDEFEAKKKLLNGEKESFFWQLWREILEALKKISAWFMAA